MSNAQDALDRLRGFPIGTDVWFFTEHFAVPQWRTGRVSTETAWPIDCLFVESWGESTRTWPGKDHKLSATFGYIHLSRIRHAESGKPTDDPRRIGRYPRKIGNVRSDRDPVLRTK